MRLRSLGRIRQTELRPEFLDEGDLRLGDHAVGLDQRRQVIEREVLVVDVVESDADVLDQFGDAALGIGGRSHAGGRGVDRVLGARLRRPRARLRELGDRVVDLLDQEGLVECLGRGPGARWRVKR